MNIDLSFWNDYRRVKVDLERLEASIMDVSSRPKDAQVRIRHVLDEARPIRVRIVSRIQRMRPKATTDYKRTSFRKLENRWSRITCILHRVNHPVHLDTKQTRRYSTEALQNLQSDIKDVVECSADMLKLLTVQQTEINSIANSVEDAKERLKHSEDQLEQAVSYSNKKRSSAFIWNMALGALCFAAVGAVGGGPVVASAVHAASQHGVALAGAAVAVAAVSSRSATRCNSRRSCSSDSLAKPDYEKKVPLEEKESIDRCTLGTEEGPPDV